MVYEMNDRATMKVAFLNLPLTGHLNPMAALARKLQSRGHGVPDIKPVVRAADLDFVPFCENEYPPGSVAKSWGGSRTYMASTWRDTWPGN
jgi:zeaxanthin glucosyltransferase